MKISISKSVIRGSVTAPSSKSYTIRALVCAALAGGNSELISPLGSDDTEACRSVLAKLGIGVTEKENSWVVHGGSFHQPDGDLFCRESAATHRFMTAVCALVPGLCRLTAAPSLARRPIEPILAPLRQLGIDCEYDEQNGSVTVRGGTLKGGEAEMPGNISSQYVSGLLFISPFASEGMKLHLSTPLESWPYVLMTLECMEKFGIKIKHSDDLRIFTAEPQRYVPAAYTVEGDWSSASYLLAMGALAGELEVKNLNTDSLQADKKILDFLQEMGASVEVQGTTVTTRKSVLQAIKANLTDCIDLLPTMGVLAAMAKGTSELSGIERGRLKESNRVLSVKTGLEKMGVKVIEEPDKLIITGSLPKGAIIDSNNDHRIAMSFSLPGLLAGNTVITDAGCVAKTYPEFWDILKSIGGEIQKDV